MQNRQDFLLKGEIWKVCATSKPIKLQSFMQLQNLYQCITYIMVILVQKSVSHSKHQSEEER